MVRNLDIPNLEIIPEENLLLTTPFSNNLPPLSSSCLPQHQTPQIQATKKKVLNILVPSELSILIEDGGATPTSLVSIIGLKIIYVKLLHVK